GKEGASNTHSNQVEASRIGLQSPSSILNEGLGVSGEHIADYICAFEFGWGKDWDGRIGRGSRGVVAVELLARDASVNQMLIFC
ncbi:hypothetical protein ALQ27_04330, partial [Pseudomonas syringae pv. delphinii]